MNQTASAGSLGRTFAWLGGAAFVLSLLVFAYVYVIRFGRVPDEPVRFSTVGPPLVINFVLFSVFALHHSLFARPWIKRWLESWVPGTLERAVYVWVASLLFAVTCLVWQPVPGMVYELEGAWRVPGWGVQGAGLWLTVAAVRAIDALELAGVRQATSRVADTPLQARGAYGLVRHPIYLGWALFTLGAPVMTATRFSFACISTLYLAVAIPLEERTLRRSFGAAYDAYRRQVRWRMVPGLY